jgi:hypothetical protein
MQIYIYNLTHNTLGKIANYTGRSITQLIQPADEKAERYVFRVQNSRVCNFDLVSHHLTHY